VDLDGFLKRTGRATGQQEGGQLDEGQEGGRKRQLARCSRKTQDKFAIASMAKKPLHCCTGAHARVWRCIYTYVHMHMYIHICICTYICICIYIYIHAYMYVYVCVCIYMSMYACIHIYMYMCICIYICTYTSPYTFLQRVCMHSQVLLSTREEILLIEIQMEGQV